MTKSFTLNIPKELSSITLRQYQRYLKLAKDNDSEEAKDFLNMKFIEVFCDVSLREAYQIPVSEFNPIIDHINGLFKEDTPLQRDIKIVDIDGTELNLGFIPKLEDMTMGEFVDLDSYIGDWDNMHKAMAVLYRPMKYKRKDKYLIHDYKASEEYHELMKDMPVSIALGAMVFFYRLGKELSKYSMDYLLQQVQKEEAPIRKALEKNGVGINQFTHSLKEMSETLTRLPNSLTNNVLYG